MKLDTETQFSLLLFGHLAKSGKITDCGDVTEICNTFMALTHEKGYRVTRTSSITAKIEAADKMAEALQKAFQSLDGFIPATFVKKDVAEALAHWHTLNGAAKERGGV